MPVAVLLQRRAFAMPVARGELVGELVQQHVAGFARTRSCRSPSARDDEPASLTRGRPDHLPVGGRAASSSAASSSTSALSQPGLGLVPAIAARALAAASFAASAWPSRCSARARNSQSWNSPPSGWTAHPFPEHLRRLLESARPNQHAPRVCRNRCRNGLSSFVLRGRPPHARRGESGPDRPRRGRGPVVGGARSEGERLRRGDRVAQVQRRSRRRHPPRDPGARGPVAGAIPGLQTGDGQMVAVLDREVRICSRQSSGASPPGSSRRVGSPGDGPFDRLDDHGRARPRGGSAVSMSAAARSRARPGLPARPGPRTEPSPPG